MRSKLCTSLIATVIVLSNLLTGATSLTEVYSINNESEGTYKVSEERLRYVGNSLGTNIDYNPFSQYKNIKNENSEMSWLLERDYLTKDIDLSCGRYALSSTLNQDTYYKTNLSVTKSDFIAGLAKIFYGVESSRAIVFNTKYELGIMTRGNGVRLDPKGKYGVYFTPNVYEIYFTKMLDKGFIDISEFKDINFIKDYTNYKSNNVPEWSNDYSNNSYNSSSRDKNFGNRLGYSISAKLEGDSLEVVHSAPDYFINESMDTMEALKILENILRQEDKQMTDTEARTIMYKYGADYLLNLDSESQKTVMYLISLGILNFENREDFSNLFSGLTPEMFTTLLYRTANKSARFDFSKIQLTDSDNYWLNKGMYESQVSIVESSYSRVEGSVELVSNDQISNSGLVKRRGVVFADSSDQTYKVKRTYDLSSSYTYRGIKIEDSAEFKALDEKPEIQINGALSSGQVSVVYTISAGSSVKAAALIDSRTIRNDDNYKVVGKIPTVVSVDDESGSKKFYIPKSMLDSKFNEFDIGYVDDKVLYNTKTGARAVLSNSLALVGNEIVSTSSPTVVGFESEVYYDLEVVSRLMTRASLEKLGMDAGKLYVCPEAKDSAVKTISNSLGGSAIDKAYTIKLDNVRKDGRVVDRAHEDVLITKNFYSLVHTTSALNTMYKKVGKSETTGYPIYMVVDWKFIVPSNAQAMNASTYAEFQKYDSVSDNPSVSAMSNFLNKRPQETLLAKWWDSNIGLSDALCNYMYGSSGLSYFKSGYMAPSVSILCRDPLAQSEVDSITSELKFSGEYINNFLSSSNSIVSALFTGGDDVYGQLASSREFNVLEGFKLNDTELIEFGDFAIDVNNALFRSYGDITGPLGEKRLRDSSDSNLVLQDRDYKDDDSIKLYNVYTLDGEKYFCSGISSADGKIAYQMTKCDYLVGSINFDSSGTMVWKNTDYSSTREVTTKLSKDGTESKYFSIPADNEWLEKSIGRSPVIPIENDPILGYPKEVASYVGYYNETWKSDQPFAGDGNQSIVNVTKDGDSFKSTVQFSSDFKINDVTDNIRLYPNIFLNHFVWKADENGVLYKSDQTPYLIRPNLRNVGVTGAVMDSIMYQSYDSKQASKIPNGTSITISGIKFTKNGGTLISEPVSCAQINNELLGQVNNKLALSSSISKLFDGEAIMINGGVHSLNESSTMSALCDYLVKDESGLPSISIADSTETTGGSTLIKRNNTFYLLDQKGKVTSYEEGMSFDSIVFSVAFNDSLLFRPVNNEKTEWTLMPISSTQADGYLTKVPFFTERLGYSWDDDVYSRMIKSIYKEAENSDTLMSAMKIWFNKMKVKDWKTFTKMCLMIVVAYLWIINFVVYVMKKLLPGFVGILDGIHHPNGENSTGIDLIKVISLGTKSLDVEEKFTTNFGVGVLLTLILLSVGKLM